MSELAYTAKGDRFTVTEQVAGWRLYMIKPRGAPGLMYGVDGAPLTLPIQATLEDLRAAVSSSGKYRLDPIDEEDKIVEGVPAAYIQVTKERNAAPTTNEHVFDARNENATGSLAHALIEVVKLNSEAMRQNAEISMRAVDRLPQLMEAMTTMLNVAAGTGLYAIQQRELAPQGYRNAADEDDEDDEEDEEDDEDDEDEPSEKPPMTIAGFPLPPGLDINKVAAQAASEVVTNLLTRIGWKMPTSLASVVDLRKAHAEGVSERAAKNASASFVPPAPHVPPAPQVHRAPSPVASPGSPSNGEENLFPKDPASMMHFLAVRNALSPQERELVAAMADELSDTERAMWFRELRSLSVPDAVAKVRATLVQLVQNAAAPPTPGTPSS